MHWELFGSARMNSPARVAATAGRPAAGMKSAALMELRLLTAALVELMELRLLTAAALMELRLLAAWMGLLVKPILAVECIRMERTRLGAGMEAIVGVEGVRVRLAACAEFVLLMSAEVMMTASTAKAGTAAHMMVAAPAFASLSQNPAEPLGSRDMYASSSVTVVKVRTGVSLLLRRDIVTSPNAEEEARIYDRMQRAARCPALF